MHVMIQCSEQASRFIIFMFQQRRLEQLTRQVILMIYGQLNDYKVRLWKLVSYQTCSTCSFNSFNHAGCRSGLMKGQDYKQFLTAL